jgi:hypothetical protein
MSQQADVWTLAELFSNICAAPRALFLHLNGRRLCEVRLRVTSAFGDELDCGGRRGLTLFGKIRCEEQTLSNIGEPRLIMCTRLASYALVSYQLVKITDNLLGFLSHQPSAGSISISHRLRFFIAPFQSLENSRISLNRGQSVHP